MIIVDDVNKSMQNKLRVGSEQESSIPESMQPDQAVVHG
jgi:hypothetical protein